ncbi:hypothetical protein FF38_01805 [Lucilia cuprina]|uniref:Uncharacterized protein n=1 Tax=Lucilia cuprina TaxID=7375 RepID=A0A0L0C1V8_LUCCU|nr:hypothetical protein FF38_01805 [Lucilia cuprina]
MIHNTLIEIFTTQVSVTVGSNYFKDTVIDGQQGNIEGTATQIEDQNVLFTFLLVQTVSNSSGSGFVNDTHNIQTSNDASILGSLTLSIIKVSGYSDNSMSNLLAQVGFSGFLHFTQNHSRDFFGSKDLFALRSLNRDMGFRVLFNNLEGEEFNVMLNVAVAPFTTNQTFSIKDSIFRICGQLILGGITNQTFTIGSKGNIGGSNTITLIVGNNFYATIFVNTNTKGEKERTKIKVRVNN